MDMVNEGAVLRELAEVAPIKEFYAGMVRYPYCRLSSRNFELLNYALFGTSAPGGDTRAWDGVSIGTVGSDKGRDLVLTHQGRLCGVVQCKGGSQRVSLPEVLRELAKTVLRLDIDDTVQCNVGNVLYFLALANDPAQTVIDLFSRPRDVLRSRASDLDAAVKQVLRSHKALREVDGDTARATVHKALDVMPLSLVRPVDLDLWLWKQTQTATRFFHHGSVLVEDSRLRGIAEELARVSRAVEGVRVLEDVDLQVIKNHIENVPESHRLSLGFASLFGFPKEMFSDASDFRRRVALIADLMNELHGEYLAWMFQRAHAEAERICQKPDVMIQVRPFGRQIPLAFLGTVARDLTVRALHGKAGGKIVEDATGEKIFGIYAERMAHVRGALMDQGRQYLAGDYSKVVGDADLLALKLKVIRFMMEGIRDESELERVVDAGEAVLRPYLEESTRTLEEFGSHRPSVFLMGTSGLDSSKQMSRMGQTLKSLHEAGE